MNAVAQLSLMKFFLSAESKPERLVHLDMTTDIAGSSPADNTFGETLFRQ